MFASMPRSAYSGSQWLVFSFSSFAFVVGSGNYSDIFFLLIMLMSVSDVWRQTHPSSIMAKRMEVQTINFAWPFWCEVLWDCDVGSHFHGRWIEVCVGLNNERPCRHTRVGSQDSRITFDFPILLLSVFRVQLFSWFWKICPSSWWHVCICSRYFGRAIVRLPQPTILLKGIFAPVRLGINVFVLQYGGDQTSQDERRCSFRRSFQVGASSATESGYGWHLCTCYHKNLAGADHRKTVLAEWTFSDLPRHTRMTGAPWENAEDILHGYWSDELGVRWWSSTSSTGGSGLQTTHHSQLWQFRALLFLLGSGHSHMRMNSKSGRSHWLLRRWIVGKRRLEHYCSNHINWCEDVRMISSPEEKELFLIFGQCKLRDVVSQSRSVFYDVLNGIILTMCLCSSLVSVCHLHGHSSPKMQRHFKPELLEREVGVKLSWTSALSVWHAFSFDTLVLTMISRLN